MTQQIAKHLAAFEGLGAPGVDVLDAREGWGIFPAGCKVLWARQDILGQERRRLRYEWKLRLHRKKDPRGEDPGVQPMLERLRFWVEQLPDMGEDQTARLENARLTAQNKEALARYEASLIVELTR